MAIFYVFEPLAITNALITSDRTWKFWTTSVPKTEELFKGTEKTKANFYRSISFENDTSERFESVILNITLICSFLTT